MHKIASAAVSEREGWFEGADGVRLFDRAWLPDGAAKVASQSNGTTAYHVVNGHCDCRDYEKAPHNLCKHRLSAAIARRTKLAASSPRTSAVARPVPCAPCATPA